MHFPHQLPSVLAYLLKRMPSPTKGIHNHEESRPGPCGSFAAIFTLGSFAEPLSPAAHDVTGPGGY